MKRIILIILIISLILTISACGGEKVSQDEVKQEDSISTDIEYEVVEKNEFHIPNAKRYSWEVVVKEKVNAEQLEELSKEIIEIAKKETKFNSISVGFYDREEYIGTGFTLGKVEYAPEGDWGKANTVKTGEYDKMDYNYSLMEKDWDKQLVKEEVKIYKAWKDLYEEKDTGSDLPDEDEINEEIASQFNISKDEVSEIMLKQITWQFDNISK